MSFKVLIFPCGDASNLKYTLIHDFLFLLGNTLHFLLKTNYVKYLHDAKVKTIRQSI